MPDLGHEESLREEHDLTDLLHVWNDHDHRTEQRLDGLGYLRASSVARVHCNEDSNAVIHCDLLTLELQFNSHNIYSPLIRR